MEKHEEMCLLLLFMFMQISLEVNYNYDLWNLQMQMMVLLKKRRFVASFERGCRAGPNHSLLQHQVLRIYDPCDPEAERSPSLLQVVARGRCL